MGKRGVTRPMAEHGHHDEGEHAMSRDERMSMLHMHHQQTLWVYWTLILLGVWTMAAPASLGYLHEAHWVDPGGGRGAWLSTQPHTALRAWLMTWSDVITGLLLVIFGWRSLVPNRPISVWVCCFLGVWLTLAPIFFWAPTAAAYLNDTVIGALVIALTILIPGMPNMIMFMQMGPATPRGWTYNPSSWPQRWIMIVFAAAGWFVSRYLAVYQLGYIDHVWDPFFTFPAGTQKVLDSDMSHMWPISDAGLGAVSYTFEFLMGYMGSRARWRTMPWMVTFFGILVIPLGLTHILLVISQPVLVHHWCSMCLLAAALMLPMIPLQADEVVAMGQHMLEAKRRGDRGGSWWQIFWKGGSAEGCTPDERSPELAEMPQHPRHVLASTIWGMTFPWTLSVSVALGLWLMFSPTAFGLDITTRAADVGHLGGALIVTVAVVAMAEVLRIGRYLNVLLGLLVAGVPWLLESASLSFAFSAALTGLIVVALALPRGPKRDQYGLWDEYVR